MCPEQDGRLMTEPMRRTDELTMSGHRIPFVYNDTPEMEKKKKQSNRNVTLQANLN